MRITSQFRMQGIGIVELMVTMLLGALLTAGIVALFNANRQSFRLQDNLAVAQEAGSFALDFIGRDLRIAGYPGDINNAVGAFDVDNTVNDRVESRDRDLPGGTVTVDYTDDQLATVFRPDVYSAQTDCTGAAIPAGTDFASNRYWVRDTADGLDRELVCQGFVLTTNGNDITAWTPIADPEALISGVESFQVLYGVDTSFDVNPLAATLGACVESPDMPNQYLPGDELAAALKYGEHASSGGSAPACAFPMSQLSMIRAVRIGLLVRTSADVDATVPADQSYTVLDRTLDAANFPIIQDGRVRRVFVTTVALRNTERVLE